MDLIDAVKGNVFVLAPHTDDGELGCGATIAKMVEANINVFYIAFSICEESVPDGFPKDILAHEVKNATSVLGIKNENLVINKFKVRRFPEQRQEILEELVALNRKHKPELIFMPSSFDVHQDHNTIYQEGKRAFKNQTILGYEFMWNNFKFNSTCISVVDEKHILKKVEAMDEYKSQERRFYAKEKLIHGLGNFRGLQVSKEYAEAFEVIRLVV